jgi:serine/threonine protein phosphatase PrpC
VHRDLLETSPGTSEDYLWRDGALTALTRDHSLVAALVADDSVVAAGIG